MLQKKLYTGIACLLFSAVALWGAVTVRIKDIATVQGIRENQLLGYGLVVGLGGKGDSARSGLTKRTIRTLLRNLGINVEQEGLLSRNSAVVVVTADIKPFARAGDRIDVTVSSLADARSLKGGVLLQTPLKAADNVVYAVAQGQVLVGGSEQTTLNSGTIPKGALVERRVDASFYTNNTIRITLRDGDFTTMNNLAQAVAKAVPGIRMRILDPTTITFTVPAADRNNPVAFIARLEVLEVSTDTPARVVVDSKSGTVVMGENVAISTVAVSYNGIRISVGADAALTREHNKKDATHLLPASANVKSLVDGLNRIGAKSQDIINILQAIEKAGALKARLIIM